MPQFRSGLVHTPVTPFKADNSVDYETYGKLLEFHVRHGADSLALPMHAGESVSLTDGERRELLEFAVKKVGGRVPVIAHVSESGTAMAADLARHAERAGAAAIVATTPYYWTPPAGMLLEHFVQIGSAVKLPFFIYNTPDELPGNKVTTDLVLKLMERVPTLAGIVDASLDWQFMIQVLASAKRVRSDFQLISGTEYMVSAGAIGATGVFAPLAGIAPKLVRELYERFREDQHHEARAVQEQIAELRQVVRRASVAGLKAGMRAMARDCGVPRAPLEPLSAEHTGVLERGLANMAALRGSPRGW
jgi:4-hydroxy-tetrahydrodipicolinate synthase